MRAIDVIFWGLFTVTGGAGCGRRDSMPTRAAGDPFARSAEAARVREAHLRVPTVAATGLAVLPAVPRVTVSATAIGFDNAVAMASWPAAQREIAVRAVGAALVETYPIDRRDLVPLRQGHLPPEAARGLIIQPLAEPLQHAARLEQAFLRRDPAARASGLSAALFIEENVPMHTAIRVIYTLTQSGFGRLFFAVEGPDRRSRLGLEYRMPHIGDLPDVMESVNAQVDLTMRMLGGYVPIVDAGGGATLPTFASLGRVVPQVQLRRDETVVFWGSARLTGDCTRLADRNAARGTGDGVPSLDENGLRACLRRASEASRQQGVEPMRRVDVGADGERSFGDFLRAMSASLDEDAGPQPRQVGIAVLRGS
jgi:hypothetical protein